MYKHSDREMTFAKSDLGCCCILGFPAVAYVGISYICIR